MRRMNPDRYRKDDPDRKFLWSRVWRERIRPAWLAEHPLCEFCLLLGQTVPATEIDHVKRPEGDWELQRDFANLRSLCGWHHRKKSRWEEGNRKRPLVIGHDSRGWPVELAGDKRREER